MKELDDTLKCYLTETRFLISELKNHPKNYRELLRFLSMTKDNSRILGYTQIYNLYKAVEDIYKALCDKKLIFSENLVLLLNLVADKLAECCNLLEANSPEFQDIDVRPYLLYCDKAVAGEIFDPNHLIRHTEMDKWLAHKLKIARARKHKAEKRPDEFLKIQADKISNIVNLHEEMIARTYIISNQIAMLKTAISDKNMHDINEAYKLLANDSQNLQNSLLITHENLMSLILDDSFKKSHQEYQGFFVMANGSKYLIPSSYISWLRNSSEPEDCKIYSRKRNRRRSRCPGRRNSCIQPFFTFAWSESKEPQHS